MTRRLHIAIVLPDLRIGGGQRVMIGLSRQFVSAGHAVELITLAGDGALSAEIPAGVSCHSLIHGRGSGLRLAMAALPLLAMRLRSGHYDVVLSSMTGTNLLSVLAWVLAGKPGRLILREAVSLHNTRSAALRRAVRACYDLADRVICVSAGIAEGLAQHGIHPGRLTVITNPVDAERLRALSAQSVWMPDTGGMPYLVSIGRLTEQKDQATLLRAYASSGAVKTHHLVLVGDGETRGALHVLARELGISARVHFAGAMANPYPVLAGAALLVLSSRWEGCPNVILEALSLGVPVVATDCPTGPRELLADGRYGRIVPVADAAAMASAIDAELSQSSAGSGEMLSGHQPEEIARQYMALMADMQGLRS